MEYTLQLDKKYKRNILIALILCMGLFVYFTFNTMGIKGYALSTGLIFFTLLAPLFFDKYSFFLFVWILIVPFLDMYRGVLVGNTNVFTYFVTGLTFPVAFILIYRNSHKIIKDFPYIKYLLTLLILILLNFFRPGVHLMEIFNVFKFHFIEIFIIFCIYSYIKEKNGCPDKIFKWMAVLAFTNSSFIIFQKLTGMWLKIIEGIPRPAGILGHPVDSGFFTNIFLPIGVYLFLKAETKKQKIFLGITIALCTFSIILSLTKVAYLTLAFSIFIIFLYLPKKHKINFMFTVTGLSLLFVFLNFILNLGIIENIISRASNTLSWSWRLKIWKSLINNINPVSFFIGNGIGSGSEHIRMFFPGDPTATHNLYIQMFYEYGILGWTYFLLLFSLAFRFLKATYNKVMENRFIYIVPFLVISVLLIDSLANITAICSRTAVMCAWITMLVFYLKLTAEEKSIKTNFTKCNKLLKINY